MAAAVTACGTKSPVGPTSNARAPQQHLSMQQIRALMAKAGPAPLPFALPIARDLISLSATDSVFLYDFNDLTPIAPDADPTGMTLSGPYQGLTFINTAYLAVVDDGSGTNNVLLGTSDPSLGAYENQIQLPLPASSVSISSLVFDATVPAELIAYDAAGNQLGTATFTSSIWTTETVTADGIDHIGLKSAGFSNLWDNLTVDYMIGGPGDPATKNDCKNGGWDTYQFKNQGQCVRFIETHKDSRK
jgi:hypothetical protein